MVRDGASRLLTMRVWHLASSASSLLRHLLRPHPEEHRQRRCVSKDGSDTPPPSRDASRPSYPSSSSLEKSEGAGNAGRHVRAGGSCGKEKTTRSLVTTGSPEASGIPCAMVLRFPSWSPW